MSRAIPQAEAEAVFGVGADTNQAVVPVDIPKLPMQWGPWHLVHLLTSPLAVVLRF